MKKTVLLLGLIFITTFIFSQNKSLNDYKYVVVPSQFSFVKGADQYQLNSLTKFLFNKYGFHAIMEFEQLPDDAATNNCLVLKSDVLKEKAFLKTKLKIELKNCKGEIVFRSEEGESKDKDYKKAYHQALRGAFESFNAVSYKYVPKKEKSTIERNTVAEVDNENNTIESKPVKEEVIIEEKKEKIPSEIQKNTIRTANVLYAQQTANGYQLVDTTPKVVYLLLKTNLKDVFIVKDENAIVYKEEGSWFLCYSEAETSELNIKF